MYFESRVRIVSPFLLRKIWYKYRAIFPVVLEVRRRMFCFGGCQRAQNMRRRTSKTTGKIARYLVDSFPPVDRKDARIFGCGVDFLESQFYVAT